MIEGCVTCVHLTMFTTILSQCSLMFWSPILFFGQVITIPINPKPVNPIRPFKPSFNEEYVGATISLIGREWSNRFSLFFFFFFFFFFAQIILCSSYSYMIYQHFISDKIMTRRLIPIQDSKTNDHY